MKNQKKPRKGVPPLPENSGYGSSSLIRMDLQRSNRFASELGLLWDDLESLATIAENFPPIDIGRGDISPKSVVDAFSAAMRKRMELLWEMMNNEDKPIPELAEEGGNE